jgi:hypothetical protein
MSNWPRVYGMCSFVKNVNFENFNYFCFLKDLQQKLSKCIFYIKLYQIKIKLTVSDHLHALLQYFESVLILANHILTLAYHILLIAYRILKPHFLFSKLAQHRLFMLWVADAFA